VALLLLLPFVICIICRFFVLNEDRDVSSQDDVEGLAEIPLVENSILLRDELEL
jgi:hypothetical protein